LLLSLKQGVGLDDKTFGTRENVLYKLVEREGWLRGMRTMRVLSYLRMHRRPSEWHRAALVA